MTVHPLAGIRVLDLSRVLAGPWCTQLLADLGAEVIKIERPRVGDDTRHWGPPWHKVNGEKVAAYFLSANRGKRSAAIDFSTEEGAELVRRLAGYADVVVENFKVGGLAKLGLDAAALQQRNPRLVIASITGFGQDGPYADRAGYDYIIQGMGGLMSITGRPNEESGGEPLRVGVAVADLFTGLYTATAIIACLYRREKAGTGAYLDMALFDTQLAMLANQASNALISGKDPPRQGNTHPNIVPYQPFEAADQAIIIAVGNDAQFARLAELCRHPEWATHPRFATNAARVEHRSEVVGRLQQAISTRPASYWLEKLREVGIPAGPINTVTEALNDLQAQHRGMVRVLAGTPLVGSPVRVDGERADSDLPPPSLGQHTDEILNELGIELAELQRLREQRVIG